MEIQTKECTKCLETLNFSEFNKDKTNKFGISSRCKKCKGKASIELRLKRKENEKVIPSEKMCYCCKKNLSSDNFNNLKFNKDGLNNYCKVCTSQKEKDKKNKIKNVVFVDETINKECIKCNVKKSLSNFKINRKSSDNFSYICNQCVPENTWNKEKQKASEKKYRMKNPEKMKEKYKKQAKNINRRIRDSLNKRISGALFSQKNYKKNKTLEYIGCDIVFLKQWFEYQFLEEMNWDNYGNWHIDHVKPCNSFDLSKEEDIKECFNWKNLQPLWAIDNLTKNDKIDEKLIEAQKNKVSDYENKLISK